MKGRQVDLEELESRGGAVGDRPPILALPREGEAESFVVNGQPAQSLGQDRCLRRRCGRKE